MKAPQKRARRAGRPAAGRAGRAGRQAAVTIRLLTALLAGLVLALPLVDNAREAFARPGGGQTFKSSPSPRSSPSPSPRSSPSPSPRSSPSPSPYSSPSPSPRSSPSPSPYSSPSPSPYSSPSPGVYIPSGSYDSSSGSSSGVTARPSSSFSLCKVVFILLVLALIVYGIYAYQSRQSSDWSTGPSSPDVEPSRYAPSHEPGPDPALEVSQGFGFLGQHDPLFSRVLLEDFLYALYAEVQRRRGGGRLPELSAYLSAGAQQAYGGAVDEVRDIVIGALTFERVSVPGSASLRAQLTVRFISNYTEVKGGSPQAYYAEEVWTVSRDAGTPSRKPENARVIGCPSCGAPLERSLQGVCRYCNARITGEQELDWFVDSIAIEQKEARAPMLTGTVEEEGTDLPTRHHPLLQASAAALQARDPEFSWPALQARVAAIFAAFHESWTAQDLTAVRPFLSDNLFEAQSYWVNAYKRQGLRNISERPELRGQEVCKVESDGHYDLVTVRVWAQNLDYTLDASGQVVGGRRDEPRRYTEYWTLIRGKGAHGAPKAERVCPSCGAPAEQINMAGQCQHCGSKVTNGQFDWVLSRIEQDEVYNG